MPGKTALVSGANQGLGLALVRGLARRLGAGSTVYLGSRNVAKGEAATANTAGDGAKVRVLQIDVTDDGSVSAAARTVVDRHGTADIVISNAAARIHKETPQRDQLRAFADTNNFGLRRMIDTFAPALGQGGALLVVASSFGSLKNLPPILHQRLDTRRATLDDIDSIVHGWVAAVEAGAAQSEGWPDWINVPSKVLQVASMRVLAGQIAAAGNPRDLLIGAVCPGLIDTEASRPWFADMSKAASPEQGAEPILDIATGVSPRAETFGQLRQLGKTIPWT